VPIKAQYLRNQPEIGLTFSTKTNLTISYQNNENDYEQQKKEVHQADAEHQRKSANPHPSRRIILFGRPRWWNW